MRELNSHQNHRRGSWLRQHQNSKHRHPYRQLLPMTQNRFSPVTFWNITAPITASERDTRNLFADKAMDEDYYHFDSDGSCQRAECVWYP